jgi:UDP-2,3-diacylglucosamine pyrophosphatase LpxH
VSYEEEIARGLDRAVAGASHAVLNLGVARCAILSDQHKGKRDKADDFLRCEAAYHAALGYYLEAGYELWTLGDVEELWECRPADVVRAYGRTLELEAEFHRSNRYRRFYGNHDDDWMSDSAVRRWLVPFFGPIEVIECLVLTVKKGTDELGTLVLVHGHQGTRSSDRNRKVSRWVVRNVWRPVQRITGWKLTTPATSFALREQHDRAMHAWAAKQSRVVLIAGHTHRPVFIPDPGSAELENRVAELKRAGLVEEAATARAELEWLKVLESEAAPGSVKPCYFNTGCCCFSDGDCTAIEIAGGEIRLVRWPDDQGRPLRKVLRSATLEAVLAQCT